MTSTERRPNWFTNLRVRTKILALVIISTLLAVFVGVSGLTAMKAVHQANEAMYYQRVLGLEMATNLRVYSRDMRLNNTQLLISSSAERKAKYETAIVADKAALAKTIAEYRTLLAGDQAATALLEQFDLAYQGYVSALDGYMLPAARVSDVALWEQVRDEHSVDDIAGMYESVNALVEGEKKAAAAANAEAKKTYETIHAVSIAMLITGVVLIGALGVAVARSIAASVTRVRRSVTALADGDLTVRTGLTSRDELGQMGAALDSAMESLSAAVGTIDASAESLSGAATELAATSVQMAAAAQQVSRNTQTVAAGTEEMGASIREIAHNASEASRVAAKAVDAAEQTTVTVARLGESSREIGNVVKVITTIAEQTNLLALNATIEAARAGEAGKGFAVVAGEVKELAQETARATEDIARRVAAIQEDTTGAVAAIEDISQIVGSINDYQATIAAAVEEQTATTNEMSRNVSDAATGSDEIATSITGVAAAVDELAHMSSDLKSSVGTFRH